jgi:hypothetical protein
VVQEGRDNMASFMRVWAFCLSFVLRFWLIRAAPPTASQIQAHLGTGPEACVSMHFPFVAFILTSWNFDYLVEDFILLSIVENCSIDLFPNLTP